MPAVAATYGYLGSNADTVLWGADAHIHSPLELLALLQIGAKA
jgi:phosphoglycolate phosphatase